MNQTERDDAIDQMREIATLKELNDDLLAACEAMLALVKVCSKHYRSNDEHSAIEQANAAIAKAKPQPPRRNDEHAGS